MKRGTGELGVTVSLKALQWVTKGILNCKSFVPSVKTSVSLDNSEHDSQ